MACFSTANRVAALCLAWYISAAAADITYSVQTVAGSNLVGDGGSALNAQLSDAQCLALDRLGNVYIADPNNHRVRRVNAAGMIQTVAGTGYPGFSGDGGPAAQARLNAPYGLAVDGANNLYVADLGNNRVRRVSPDGVITTVAGSGQAASGGDGGSAAAAQLNAPRNLTLDGVGNLYIAEFSGHRVRMVTLDGSIQTVAGNGTAGAFGEGFAAVQSQLAYPAGLFVDFTGTLYIADSGNQRVRTVFNGIMRTLPLPGVTLALPTGISGDTAGGVYIADGGAHRLFRRTLTGAVFQVAAGLALESAREAVIDGLGDLLIADGHRVRLLTGTGFATVLAGDGTFGFHGDGGQAASATLNGPSGVAVDSAGNLYIADERNHRVRMVSGTGVISTVAGTGQPDVSPDGMAPTSTPIDAPEGLLADPSGVLWIAEYFGNRVRKLTPAGALLTVAGNGAAGFNGDARPAITAQLQEPGQTALDSSGNLYIADSGNHRIRKVSLSGAISTFAGTGSPGFSGDGGQAVSAQLTLPRGIAFDSAGNLYIADTNNNRIRKVTPGGQITTVAGGGEVTLYFPRSVAVDAAGNLFIADTGNHRIVEVAATGAQSVFAGLGAAGFGGDGGDARAAQFSTPAAITVDSSGNLYVADFDNNVVRKLTPNVPGIAAPLAQPPAARLLQAASIREGAVAPGEMLSIFADGIGPAVLATGTFDGNGILDTLLSETQVLFDGQAAPLISAQPGQIKTQVPYSVAGKAATRVQVYRSGVRRADTVLPVTDVAPGIFTVTGGTGPAAVANQDGTANSAANPAAPGSVITLLATGEGQTIPAGIDGKRSVEPYPQPAAQVVVRIGGRPAEILFAAEAPGAVGVLQINARIPDIVDSGAVVMSLSVGSATSQDGVTVFLK